MSSWNKVAKVNQNTYRERHQPEGRAKFGLLEKHKDYVRRARDYQRKQKVIQKLREEALNRNPDEFYMHMVNSELVDGVHKEKTKPEPEDTIEQKKLLQSKSLTYVTMKYTIEQKKVEKLKSELHAIDFTQKVKSNHIFFDDEDTKKKKKNNNEEGNIENNKKRLIEQSKVHPSLVENRCNRLTTDDLAKIELPNLDFKTCEQLKKIKLKRYKNLAKRIERKNQLAIIRRKMEVQQCLKDTKKVQKPKLIQKGTKTTAPVYEWKYERKR